MPAYKIQDVWVPNPHEAWGDYRLKTYWLTLADGTKCQTWRKEDSPPPKVGETIEGDLLDKTSKAGKPYKLLKKKTTREVEYVCDKCGHVGKTVLSFASKGPESHSKPSKPPETKNTASDDEPPLENYDTIPF